MGDMSSSAGILAAVRAKHKASMWATSTPAPNYVPSQASRRSLDQKLMSYPAVIENLHLRLRLRLQTERGQFVIRLPTMCPRKRREVHSTRDSRLATRLQEGLRLRLRIRLRLRVPAHRPSPSISTQFSDFDSDLSCVS